MAEPKENSGTKVSKPPKVGSKNAIAIGIPNDPLTIMMIKKDEEGKKSGESRKKDRGFEQGYDKPKEKPELRKDMALLRNKANHDITLGYDGKSIIIPPRGKMPIADRSKLEKPLPKYIYLLDMSGKRMLLGRKRK